MAKRKAERPGDLKAAVLSVVGMGMAEALEVLEAAGFVAEPDVPLEAAAEARVLGQAPPAGILWARGSLVLLNSQPEGDRAAESLDLLVRLRAVRAAEVASRHAELESDLREGVGPSHSLRWACEAQEVIRTSRIVEAAPRIAGASGVGTLGEIDDDPLIWSFAIRTGFIRTGGLWPASGGSWSAIGHEV